MTIRNILYKAKQKIKLSAIRYKLAHYGIITDRSCRGIQYIDFQDCIKDGLGGGKNPKGVYFYKIRKRRTWNYVW